MVERERDKQVDSKKVTKIMEKINEKKQEGDKANINQLHMMQKDIERKRHDLQELKLKVEVEDRAEGKRFITAFYHMAESSWFSALVNAAIILNTVCLALDRYPISDAEVNRLEQLNLFFSTVFLLEMIIKMIGLGFRCYFRDPFNSFDCFIVVISTVDVALTFTNLFKKSNGAITALRAFRLLRIFKLAKSWKKFQELLVTIGNTLKDVSNFSVLLFLFIFTYTLLGMEVFAYKVQFNSEN